MSIVKLLSEEKPKDGSVVYCDNGDFACDRAIYFNGVFIGGGEFPVPSYKMNNVSKWFYLSELNGSSISFEDAELQG